MSLWLIPMTYAAASFLSGITLPRLEQAYFPYDSGISVASAQAFFAAIASGMIALTGVVFTVGLVMVQFSAIAYSPRLVLLLARDPKLFHSLGVFIATFTYSLSVLLYVDRNESGVVPLISGFVVRHARPTRQNRRCIVHQTGRKSSSRAARPLEEGLAGPLGYDRLPRRGRREPR